MKFSGTSAPCRLPLDCDKNNPFLKHQDGTSDIISMFQGIDWKKGGRRGKEPVAAASDERPWILA